MNNGKFQKSLLLVIVGIWIVAGCSPPTPSLVSTSTDVVAGQSPSASRTLPEPTITSSLTPTLAPTQTNTPSPSKTATATITPNQALTIEPEKQEDFIKGLLKDNGGCKLPCWWGIDPGRTPWSEAAAFFRFLGERPSGYTSESGILSYLVGFQYLKQDALSILDLQLFEQDGIVNAIEITSSGYDLPDEYYSMWSEFSPEKLVQTYGKPSQVWIHTTSYMRQNLTGKHYYILWMIYDELGFFAEYSGRIEYQATYRLCPTYGSGDLDAGIDIYLQSSDSEKDLLEVSELMRYQPEVLTIEEATGLTVDDFVALFTQASKPFCFESPRDIWP